jgi:hypothetical protein
VGKLALDRKIIIHKFIYLLIHPMQYIHFKMTINDMCQFPLSSGYRRERRDGVERGLATVADGYRLPRADPI